MRFHRYGIYHMPDDPALASSGAAWLGWDGVRGVPAPQPAVDGIEAATETPRRYGFHATLKPPFRLAQDATPERLQADMARFCAARRPVRIAALQITRLGRFLALVPRAPDAALSDLAFTCVTAFDAYRAPPDAAELARRRRSGLSPRQEEMLTQWGYPHVGPEFRFHMTLTGRLPQEALARFEAAASAHLPDLSEPYEIASVSLVGEARDGRFHEVARFRLGGANV